MTDWSLVCVRQLQLYTMKYILYSCKSLYDFFKGILQIDQKGNDMSVINHKIILVQVFIQFFKYLYQSLSIMLSWQYN